MGLRNERISNAYKELLMARLATGEYLESETILEDAVGEGVETDGRKLRSFRNNDGRAGFVGPGQ